MASASAIVTDVLIDLQGRAGFDGWWGQIDKDTKDQLYEELEEVVNEHLDGDQPETRTNNTIKDIKIVRKGHGKRLFDAFATTEGGYTCRLPVTGVSYEEEFRDHGRVSLKVSSHRVTFEDIDA